MIIAVSYSDYNKYGCVKCGCEYCSVDIVSGPSTPVICGECESKFIILKDGLKKSSVGLATQKNDKDGNTIYEFPLLSVHPRKGVLKHPYVRPDIRPDNGIGEFATPRGVGYDIACFVKSKEAGKRIVEMFDKKNKEYEEMGNKFVFSCCLDYRPNEPKWIQVKIEYTNEQRAELLCALIRNNSNIITEEVIESANNMKLTVADRYKLFGVNSLLLNYDINRKLMLLINNYGSSEYDNNTLQEIYKVNYNLLAQFEMFGTGLQVHSAIHGKETQLGIESLLNFIDKYNDPFIVK